ncbi:unnamed protein product [Notodromas monacha]|uniref:Uncharacterized protein n=1 Tax=Notodromas monacha TaxID=399045 RepID=A0A7R9BG45_9CRUS|nr:unnamed protein product [Notodromas monacha]CAG0914657.1 unnamed protein product [Notodromas monacha]
MSVLEATHSPTDSVAGLISGSGGPVPSGPVKRQGVSGESSNQPLTPGGSGSAKITIPKVDKDFRCSLAEIFMLPFGFFEEASAVGSCEKRATAFVSLQ